MSSSREKVSIMQQDLGLDIGVSVVQGQKIGHIMKNDHLTNLLTEDRTISRFVRDYLIACGVLGSLVVAVGLVCGSVLRATPTQQLRWRTRHGCTVGIDQDPPV